MKGGYYIEIKTGDKIILEGIGGSIIEIKEVKA